MATKKKTAAKGVGDSTPTIIRNYDLQSMDKRLRNMEGDTVIPRNYDIFSMEERIHQLEVNGGGGSSPVKYDSGTFTTPAEQQGTIEVSFENIEGKADYIVVEFTIDGTKKTVASFDKTMYDASDTHKYCSKWIIPAENANYNIAYGATTGDAGIVGIADGKFTFKSGGSNTTGLTATYKAYAYVGE